MKKLSAALASLTFVVSLATLAACSSDSGDDDGSSSGGASSGGGGSSSSSGAATSSSGGGGGSSSSSGGGGSSSSGGGSSSSGGSSSGGTSTLNGCTQYTDNTASAATDITFSNPIPEAQRCQKVKVGTKVTWKGVNGTHPLEDEGGDANSPIPTTQNGPDVEVTFDAVGMFGYKCTNHSVMTGAIQVVEE